MWRSKGTESSSVYFMLKEAQSFGDMPNAYWDMEDKDLDHMPPS